MDVTTQIQAAVVRADMAAVTALKMGSLLLLGVFLIYIAIKLEKGAKKWYPTKKKRLSCCSQCPT